MDYERIRKPNPQEGGGGGVSPRKLRLMLLGVERARKEEDELESRCSLRSEDTEVDDRSASSSETCKDVDMVCSTFTTEMASSHHCSKDLAFANARMIRSQEGDSFESGGVPAFEFQRVERAQQLRSAFAPLSSKPAPSKWDDAQKWIASPTSSRTCKTAGAQPKKTGGAALGHGNRQCSTKVMEVEEEVETKGIVLSQLKKEATGQRTMNWVPDPYPVVDPYAKPTIFLENPVPVSSVSLSRHDSSSFIQNSTSFITPPSTIRSVSMRDMGTEMTPIASQEPSRTGTPVGDTTPLRSPTYSRPSSPGRTAPFSSPAGPIDCQEDFRKREVSEEDLQMRTRREIMALGAQLGKLNIAAWASKEEEDKNASVSHNTVAVDQPVKSIIEIRAAAWEEAEKAKYLARFKREEIKIQAWEDHQKAKAEAEMRRIEVEVERMRALAHDMLMKKLAVARHKAKEKRAAAEARNNQQAASTAQEVEFVRRTGRIPSAFSCWSCCK